MNRTQNSHVLQIRNGVPDELSSIYWLNFGVPSFSPYVPFYSNATDTDDTYKHTSMKFNFNDAYWMYRSLSMMVESHYSQFVQSDRDYLTAIRETQRRHLETTDNKAAELSEQTLIDYLTAQNKALVADMRKQTVDFIGSLVVQGAGLSKLTFNMDKNL